ncbi:MAG: GTPase ObgE [Chloroflexi bacterium]|nr:GTPase ObgE [Chloroflexota bacterium]
MFDKVEIEVRAGDGGAGAVSFRREKFVPFGGPDGGDGGDGGDVVIVADPGITSLRMFKQKRLYRAGNGGNGMGQKKHGRRGEDLILRVPPGTIIRGKTRINGGELVVDCEQSGQQVVIDNGGKGGLGNTHFTSSTNQAPQLAQRGEAGEENSLILEMRLIADVGIIGYPNAGKSTLLAAASAAKPKIADYPFTTIEPVLGMVEVGQKGFILAEIPGLIDGAHLGRGLGHDFLRHIMRTKILIHLIDGSSLSPLEDMIRVNTELSLFDAALAQKPQLVVVNKIDLPQVQTRLSQIRDTFSGAGTPVFFISAAGGEGVIELMAEAAKMLERVVAEVEVGKKVPPKVFHPQARSAGVSVHKEEDNFVVVAPALERIIARVDITNPEVRRQVQRQLARPGVRQALERAGVKPGDKVRCGNFEWEW